MTSSVNGSTARAAFRSVVMTGAAPFQSGPAQPFGPAFVRPQRRPLDPAAPPSRPSRSPNFSKSIFPRIGPFQWVSVQKIWKKFRFDASWSESPLSIPIGHYQRSEAPTFADCLVASLLANDGHGGSRPPHFDSNAHYNFDGGDCTEIVRDRGGDMA